jgi:hypothetical protein
MATDVYARWRRHQRGAQELSFCFCALEFVLLDLCHSAHLKQVQNITHNMILCALELDHSSSPSPSLSATVKSTSLFVVTVTTCDSGKI